MFRLSACKSRHLRAQPLLYYAQSLHGSFSTIGSSRNGQNIASTPQEGVVPGGSGPMMQEYGQATFTSLNLTQKQRDNLKVWISRARSQVRADPNMSSWSEEEKQARLKEAGIDARKRFAEYHNVPYPEPLRRRRPFDEDPSKRGGLTRKQRDSLKVWTYAARLKVKKDPNMSSWTEEVREAKLEAAEIEARKRFAKKHNVEFPQPISRKQRLTFEDGYVTLPETIEGKENLPEAGSINDADHSGSSKKVRSSKSRTKVENSGHNVENPRNNVEACLNKAYNPQADKFKAWKKVREKRRLHVVSEALCDDILERLGPSLQKHRGCDILDINPGCGVFSSKLHDYLRPRTHLLMEPDDAAYEPFLQPLLDTPDSTYKLIPKSGIVWGHLEGILTKENFPHQELLAENDPRRQQPNDSLLVVANFASHPRQPYRGFYSLSILLMFQLLAASRANSLFHRYGKIRMLVWLDQLSFVLLLPSNVSKQRKMAMQLDITCDTANPVVICESAADLSLRREVKLELDSIRAVSQRMTERGIKTPKGRETKAIKDLRLVSEEEEVALESLSPIHYEEELRQLEKDFEAGLFSKFVTPQKSGDEKVIPDVGDAQLTRSWSRMFRLRRRFTADTMTRKKNTQLVEEFMEVAALEKDFYEAKTAKKKSKIKSQYEERLASWKEKMQFVGVDEQVAIKLMCSNRLSFYQNPPGLRWDRRDFEPLNSEPEEFFPKHSTGMSLIDIQPGKLPAVFQENYAENWDVMEFIMTQMLVSPKTTVENALKALWPGAYEWLLAECPSLRNPSKGGSLDLSSIAVRTLPASTFVEITEAWVRWPFRPSKYELIQKLGAEVYDPNDEEA